MKDLRVDQVRNVGVFGDGGAGKTALAEAMLFTAGSIDRLGNAADGNTAMDYEPEEIKHQFSTSAALHHLQWRKTRVNLIDTPGSPNFLGDSFPALRAVDAAVFALDGIDGLRVVGERLWNRAGELGLARALVVTKIDRDRSDCAGVLEAANKTLSGTFAPLTLPLRSGEALTGVIDVLGRRALLYPADGSGKFTEGELPPEMKAEVDAAREEVIAAVAEIDDALTEKYLEQGTLSDEEVRAALRQGMTSGRVTPVFCAALTHNQGIQPLLDAIVDFFPSPVDRPAVAATDARSGESLRLASDPEGP
ncbi:MAG: hypothetical protein KC466_12420, partial [Myxococcales bacterium]|nr:hypothetical protein [Myxococcales bacterium]